MMSETEGCISMTTGMTVKGDVGRTLEAVVITEFCVLSQNLLGRTTENHENSQMGLSVY